MPLVEQFQIAGLGGDDTLGFAQSNPPSQLAQFSVPAGNQPVSFDELSARGADFAAAFSGGVLLLFGARLAGGCTSGHMMSGMMQTSLSGYLFALGAFAVAIPTAILVFGRR